MTASIKHLKKRNTRKSVLLCAPYKLVDDTGNAQVTGEFTIAGVSCEVQFNAKLTPLPPMNVGVEGSIEILMTDYGIKPP